MKPTCSKALLLVLLLCGAGVLAAAQKFQTLLKFDGTDGQSPFATLVQGTNGNFFGTTYAGGTNGVGTVFEITAAGRLFTLYSFCSKTNCADGEFPQAGLALAGNGSFLGTTIGGGVNEGGSIFAINSMGTMTTLYSFCLPTACTDGQSPVAPTVQGNDGNFYGVTPTGGINGEGTIFRVTAGGQFTGLYDFCSQSNCADGEQPKAGLVLAENGRFYGVTASGGAFGNGTFFEITPAGKLTTLFSFDGAHGANPYGTLVQGLDGNFYGTTLFGGNNCVVDGGCGTVFKITPTGTPTLLYSFCSQTNCADGEFPVSPLVQATDGNFYGTTSGGGANGFYGTVFSITPSGVLQTLYSFCSQLNCADGDSPQAGLLQSTNGSFYGTTSNGGTNQLGTVFSLNTGLGPFVTFLHSSGRVGRTFGILGQGLTGTTAVTLNGVAASFTVMSDTFTKATVPGGASTGNVVVTTPSGTLTSNVPFVVIP